MAKKKISRFKIHVISYIAGFIVLFLGMATFKYYHISFEDDSYVSLLLIAVFAFLTLMVWNLISNKKRTKK